MKRGSGKLAPASALQGLPMGNAEKTRLRTIFVSDVHLGSKGCRADLLLEFLKSVDVDYLFLVGDIVDLWAMRKNFYWPQEHNNVLRIILSKAKKGTRVIYVPGNHDEDMREFCGTVFGNLEIHREFIHNMSDGRRLLVMHGDEFDTVVKCSPWLARLGSTAYDFTLRSQSPRQFAAPPFWLSVLVARELPEAQSEECCAVHLQLRERGGARGAQARRRWSGLRAHPSRGNHRYRRRHVLQRRRLGRELLGAGRRHERPARHLVVAGNARERAVAGTGRSRRLNPFVIALSSSPCRLARRPNKQKTE